MLSHIARLIWISQQKVSLLPCTSADTFGDEMFFMAHMTRLQNFAAYDGYVNFRVERGGDTILAYIANACITQKYVIDNSLLCHSQIHSILTVIRKSFSTYKQNVFNEMPAMRRSCTAQRHGDACAKLCISPDMFRVLCLLSATAEGRAVYIARWPAILSARLREGYVFVAAPMCGR